MEQIGVGYRYLAPVHDHLQEICRVVLGRPMVLDRSNLGSWSAGKYGRSAFGCPTCSCSLIVPLFDDGVLLTRGVDRVNQRADAIWPPHVSKTSANHSLLCRRATPSMFAQVRRGHTLNARGNAARGSRYIEGRRMLTSESFAAFSMCPRSRVKKVIGHASS